MRKFLSIVFFAFFLFPAFFACAENRPAPDFQLPDLEQKTVTLSSFKNKQPVLLLFWTSWCPYCRVELRRLNQEYPALAKKGFAVLALNAGESAAKAQRFAQKTGLVYPVLLDSDTAVSEEYGLVGIPTYILIDKQGNILYFGNYFPQQKDLDLAAGLPRQPEKR